MARPDQEAIDTFMSITSVSEATAIQKIEEHLGNLNEALNAHFNEGDGSFQEASSVAPLDDVMDIDDPVPVESHRTPPSLLPSARDVNPFSLLDAISTRSILDSSGAATRSPFVSHPREVTEIPVEVKDEIGASGHSGDTPTIEDVTDTQHQHGPEIREMSIIDQNVDDRSSLNPQITHPTGYMTGDSSANSRPSAPSIVDMSDYGDDIEEEMIRAAIEASKQDSTMSNLQYDGHLDLRHPAPQPRLSHPEDAELAHAVSLSLQTAEQEKALRESEEKVGASDVGQKSAVPEDMVKLSSNGRQPRLEVGSTSLPDEAEDVEEEVRLVRSRRRRVSSSSIDHGKNIERAEVSPPLHPQQDDNIHHSHIHGNDFPSDEWGGISSEEHDEAVMLEAAMFGGIPEGDGYQFSYESHQLRRRPRPPSPSVVAQRLIREQQDDEYLASLQADKEKELKAKEEAEAALAEERHKEEELYRKLQEEQETERQLAVKEASLREEPASDDENAVTLLVRMPDGSRRGRRFLTSDKLLCLFDFIDVGRVVKPGSYRLVRPYPRRAFSVGESTSTLHELGLTSKQEALYLEMI